MVPEPDSAAVVPRRAIVVPRVRDAAGSEELPLEHFIEQLLARRSRLPVNLYGPSGSGKSTALAHLAAVMGDQIVARDGPPAGAHSAVPDRLIVYATTERRANHAFEMAPWKEDDLIEYLLHAHHAQCKSVMVRVQAAAQGSELGGMPELWTVVLDSLARDEKLVSISQALRRHIAGLVDKGTYQKAARYCLSGQKLPADAPIRVDGLPANAARLLRHRFVKSLLASEALAADVEAGEHRMLRDALPHEILQETAILLRDSSRARSALIRTIDSDPVRQPMAVSLLVRAAQTWRPGDNLSNLREAPLAGVQWPGVNLSKCLLENVHLAHANLTDAQLEGAQAGGANLRCVLLCRAQMHDISAAGADLLGADLTGVQAEGADFEGAMLAGAKFRAARLDRAIFDRAQLGGADFTAGSLVAARFRHCQIGDADFSQADFTKAQLTETVLRAATLTGTCFHAAKLIACNLEGVEILNADFCDADLRQSYLTASVMPRANFHGASLRGTGLAEIDWEEADLRGVDFRGATFHMGSSRSGLVQSTIASEGSRTGFYTDDYNDQDFKAPEEIRKANLCGSDLRGAHVEETDFYLVDLRRAIYSAEQGRHFARCGAILHSRA